MAVHVGQMTGVAEMQSMYDAVTVNSAKAMQLDGYGLEVGCNADLVILQARDKIEAIRLKPARLYVIRRGKIISQTEPVIANLNLNGENHQVDFLK